MLIDIDGKDYPNLIVNMQCNGVMYTPKMWRKIHKIHNNLGDARISFDAAYKDTYENKTRLGGNWNLLLQNCDFLNEQQDEFHKFKIYYDFVVQSDNYEEMPHFVNLIRSRYSNAYGISFNLVTDWGTWSKEEYTQKCIWKTTHPEHDKFLEILEDPIFGHPLVFLGNVQPYRDKAINNE